MFFFSFQHSGIEKAVCVSPPVGEAAADALSNIRNFWYCSCPTVGIASQLFGSNLAPELSLPLAFLNSRFYRFFFFPAVVI